MSVETVLIALGAGVAMGVPLWFVFFLLVRAVAGPAQGEGE